LSSKFTPNNAHNLLTDDEDDEKTHIKPSKMSTEQEKEIIKNILKSNSPKLVIKKIPVSFINSTNISAVKVSAIVESQCRLTKDLLGNCLMKYLKIIYFILKIILYLYLKLQIQFSKIIE